MQNLKRTFWGTLGVLVLLWLIAEPSVFQSAAFFALRGACIFTLKFFFSTSKTNSMALW